VRMKHVIIIIVSKGFAGPRNRTREEGTVAHGLTRALTQVEFYLPPFRGAIQGAHVRSLM
jgi:hypothetical protein